MTIADLIARWTGTEGGAERANYQMFLSEFAHALDLPPPAPKGMGLGSYEFEAPVKSEAALGRKGTGRIDLYKRDCFILEAKQSQLKQGEAAPPEPVEPPPAVVYDLFGHAIGTAEPVRPVRRYDRLMADARLQAERYALALPGDHKAPPFLLVADIGRAFELYFDWAGNGRGYAPFPDEQQYRITLTQLADPRLLPGVDLDAADLLRAIWTAPAGVDPRLKAAAVTREIAARLSRVAAQLETDERNRHPGKTEIAMGIEATSLFLMRMLFCMFAEDVELLRKDSFTAFLEEAKTKSVHFWRSGLNDLWRRMNDPDEANRYWPHGDALVRYFNGNLFDAVQIYDLPDEFKGELLVAAKKDWRKVEPAIFGTLLEQVLTPADRAKLGAHYTPRAHVDRLVEATVMEVLRPEWEAVREEAQGLLATALSAPLPLAGGVGGGRVDDAADMPFPNPSREREGDSGKLHLTLAIPDHPWTRVTKDAAAVRIAMTVAQGGAGTGRLVTITRGRAIDTDAPELEVATAHGVINADLSVGTDVTQVVSLKANEGISNTGMLLAGQGFKVDADKADVLIASDQDSARAVIRYYVGGGELMKRPRMRSVIDFFGLDERAARQKYPTCYDHVLRHVKSERDLNPQKSRREK